MLSAIIAYFLIIDNKDMTTEEKDCGCGGTVKKECTCKKNKTAKVVVVILVSAAVIGIGYWAYTKGYFDTVIDKIKELSSKKV